MHKIIYLGNNEEIKIGDVIDITSSINITDGDNLTVKVTEKLIENNPDLFKVEDMSIYHKHINNSGKFGVFTKGKIYKVENYRRGRLVLRDDMSNIWVVGVGDFELSTKDEYDKQELLGEAIRRYPVGTMFKSMFYFDKFNLVVEKSNPKWSYDTIVISTDVFPTGGTIYRNGKWAEIIPYKFISEDGVKIHEGMKTCVVGEDLKLFESDTYDGYLSDHKYFYHKENALAYIKKHKEKSLEDYENILFDNISTFTFAPEGAYFSVWGWIKEKEPKLFYTKVLQLIADDLNDGWIADINDETQKKWFIDSLGVKAHRLVNYGLTYFKSGKTALKARSVITDAMKYLFD